MRAPTKVKKYLHHIIIWCVYTLSINISSYYYGPTYTQYIPPIDNDAYRKMEQLKKLTCSASSVGLIGLALHQISSARNQRNDNHIYEQYAYQAYQAYQANQNYTPPPPKQYRLIDINVHPYSRHAQNFHTNLVNLSNDTVRLYHIAHQYHHGESGLFHRMTEMQHYIDGKPNYIMDALRSTVKYLASKCKKIKEPAPLSLSNIGNDYFSNHNLNITSIEHRFLDEKSIETHTDCINLLEDIATYAHTDGNNVYLIAAHQYTQCAIWLHKMNDIPSAHALQNIAQQLLAFMQAPLYTQITSSSEAECNPIITTICTTIAKITKPQDQYHYDISRYDKILYENAQILNAIKVPYAQPNTPRLWAYNALTKILKDISINFCNPIKQREWQAHEYLKNIICRDAPNSSSAFNIQPNNNPGSPRPPNHDDDDYVTSILKKIRTLIDNNVTNYMNACVSALKKNHITHAQSYAHIIGWNPDTINQYMEKDAHGVPCVCYHDPLYQVLVLLEKEHLIKEKLGSKFIALLINRHEQHTNFIKAHNLEPLCAKNSLVNQLIYDFMHLSKSNFKRTLSKFIHVLPKMSPSSRKTALQDLINYMRNTNAFNNIPSDEDVQDDIIPPVRHTNATNTYGLSRYLENLLDQLGIAKYKARNFFGNHKNPPRCQRIIDAVDEVMQTDCPIPDILNELINIAFQLGRLGIAFDRLGDTNNVEIIEHAIHGISSIARGVTRAAYREATDMHAWVVSIGVASCITSIGIISPGAVTAISSGTLLYVISHAAWSAMELYYNPERLQQIKEGLTLEDAADTVAGFTIACMRDHMVQGVVNNFISSIGSKFIKNGLAENSTHTSRPPPKTPPQIRHKKGSSTSPTKQISKYKTLQQEIAKLQAKFANKLKGYGILKDKNIIIDLEHILEPEIKTFVEHGQIKIKSSGWHHDLMGVIERTGRFNGHKIEIIKKTKLANDVYTIKWRFVGERYPKKSTMYPKHWTREKVIKKIVKAYETCKNKNTDIFIDKKTGNYVIYGEIKKKIPIKMIITPEGKLRSAYIDFFMKDKK